MKHSPQHCLTVVRIHLESIVAQTADITIIRSEELYNVYNPINPNALVVTVFYKVRQEMVQHHGRIKSFNLVAADMLENIDIGSTQTIRTVEVEMKFDKLSVKSQRIEVSSQRL